MREQRAFLTLVFALMTFLVVLCLGLTIGVGTAVTKWNAQWNRTASVQIMPSGNVDAARKILESGRTRAVRDVPQGEVKRIVGAWISNNSALENYIPTVLEVSFANTADARAMAAKFDNVPNTRFISYAGGMKHITRAGWQIMGLSAFVMFAVLAAIALCILHIVRNITLIHRREIEILNQIGARDGFIARQLATIMARTCAVAAFFGLIATVPVLLFIIYMARGTRVGLMAQMTMPDWGWGVMLLMAIGIVAASVYIARRATLQLLGEGRIV
ncbi:MAG: ABC transporter permease [Rickettsiales bacterium]|jgi:cell division protein FtsX|nr:ABC transporter permease [Rickettsiales bacterium]